jgi:hypothetical protein
VSSGAIIVSELRPKVLESYRARQGAAAGPAAVDNAISQSLTHTHASTFIEPDRGRDAAGRPACVHLPLSRNHYVAAALLRMHRGAAKISHSAKDRERCADAFSFSLSLSVRAPYNCTRPRVVARHIQLPQQIIASTRAVKCPEQRNRGGSSQSAVCN